MILYYNGPSTNHGCEAIVRSTQKLLGERLTLVSSYPAADRAYGLDAIVHIQEDHIVPLRKPSIKWLAYAVHHKLTGSDELYTRFSHDSFFSTVNRGDICLSVGGDNYCYAGQDVLAYYNRILHSRGAKTVLWGCSVEPELTREPAVAHDLATYDLITARETISYNALKEVNPNTVLVSDPAFVLDKVELPDPPSWQEGNMIGINASPLILSSGDGTLVLEAYIKLVDRILQTTKCSVVLIPHVVFEHNDDRSVLELLYNTFRDTGRVILLGDYNCMELKGYIARCRLFIGARTHATIAAYSSMVPTLALGYSVKSRGIARDIFGTENHYVIPVQSIISNSILADGFDWLLAHEHEIRSHLKSVMPEYNHKAYISVEALSALK